MAGETGKGRDLKMPKTEEEPLWSPNSDLWRVLTAGEPSAGNLQTGLSSHNQKAAATEDRNAACKTGREQASSSTLAGQWAQKQSEQRRCSPTRQNKQVVAENAAAELAQVQKLATTHALNRHLVMGFPRSSYKPIHLWDLLLWGYSVEHVPPVLYQPHSPWESSSVPTLLQPALHPALDPLSTCHRTSMHVH